MGLKPIQLKWLWSRIERWLIATTVQWPIPIVNGRISITINDGSKLNAIYVVAIKYALLNVTRLILAINDATVNDVVTNGLNES